MHIVIDKIWKPGENECYIGSTKNYKNRMRKHKSNCYNEKSKEYNYFIYQFIRQNGGWDEFCKEIIHECDVKDNIEKRMVEKEYIKKYESKLNTYDSYLGEVEKKEKHKKHQKNWYEENKEKIKEKHREWRKENKEQIKEKYKNYYEGKYKEKRKERYEKNKEQISNKNKIKVQCPHCNIELSKASLTRHIKHSCKMINK